MERISKTIAQVDELNIRLLQNERPMQIKDLTPEEKLSVPCPVCAAAPRERCCEVRSGAFRYEEHLARLLSAAGQEKLPLLPSSKTISGRK